VKGKFVPLLAVIECNGSRGIELIPVTSAVDGDEWLTLRPSHFIPRKEPRYALNERLSRSRIQSGNFGEEGSIFPLPTCARDGLETPLHFCEKTATI
jgi:hypothetical protein